MDIAESKRKWGDTKTAVFSAGHVDPRGPKVYVYPRKRKPGYVWCIWHSHDFAHSDKSIKCGGVSKMPLRRTCEMAVKKLFAYRGRAVGKPSKRRSR